MIYYTQLLKDFTLKSKYRNRIGVTKVIFEEKAENYIKNNFDQKDIFIKNRFAKSFSSFLAFHNNLAIVPFSQDRTSRTIMLTYENTQREIKLPDPDYHIHLTIRGFKNVLFKEGNINSQWIYGSYVNIKILQPDFPDENKDCLNFNLVIHKNTNGEMAVRKEPRVNPSEKLSKIAHSTLEELENG